MSSINWSAPNMWVFIAQLVGQRGDIRRRRHGFKSRWSAKILFRAKICSCLNCNYNCDDHIFISSVFPQFKITFNQYLTSVLRKAKGFRFHLWWENSKVAEQGELTIRYLQQESLDVFFWFHSIGRSRCLHRQTRSRFYHPLPSRLVELETPIGKWDRTHITRK